ncbi:MAG: serine/threonine protein kinase [Candidatus Saganbacteria bacterium]|nr:serine/threonine protein kinase [Candidatus Saganbacteria bacterium]
MKPTIWQELTPDNIFKAVESALGKQLSNICLKRNSYINRVYELEAEASGERFIVKFYRPNRWTKDQILEEHAFLNELLTNEIPVVPPSSIDGRTLFESSALRSTFYSLFPKKGGRAVDEFDKEGWQTLGRTVGRLHLIGAKHKSSRRIIWKPEIATRHHRQMIDRTNFLLPDFKKSFDNACELFIRKAEPRFKDQPMFLLHGDLHKGNLLYRPNEGLFVVDFDDMSFGPMLQDIWLLLPEGLNSDSEEFNWFLEGYETFRAFDWESLPLKPALQGMRIIHYAAWLAVQCEEPDFDNHFPHAGSARYWNQLIKDLLDLVQQQL